MVMFIDQITAKQLRLNDKECRSCLKASRHTVTFRPCMLLKDGAIVQGDGSYRSSSNLGPVHGPGLSRKAGSSFLPRLLGSQKHLIGLVGTSKNRMREL